MMTNADMTMHWTNPLHLEVGTKVSLRSSGFTTTVKRVWAMPHTNAVRIELATGLVMTADDDDLLLVLGNGRASGLPTLRG